MLTLSETGPPETITPKIIAESLAAIRCEDRSEGLIIGTSGAVMVWGGRL
jgi:hypothetical protein